MPLPLSGTPTNFVDATIGSATLVGTDGNDQLKTFYGKVGSSESFMYGGLGDDTYIVLSSKDRIYEDAGSGIDTVKSDWFYSLPNNVENMILTGTLSVGATGNALNNIIIGNSGKNIIEGGLGNDELTGGGGNDMFVVSGSDQIMDFAAGDYLDLRAFSSFTDFSQVAAKLSQQGTDTVLTLSPTDNVIFKNTSVSSFDQSDFLMAGDMGKYTLTFADEFDTLSLNYGTGSDGTWYPLYPRSGLSAHTTIGKSVQYFTYLGDTGSLGELVGIDPFSVNDGIATISMNPIPRAEQRKAYGYDYSSGMLNTSASFSQTYGYFEIRVALPAGQGLHDSFWMLPINNSAKPEFDVVEGIGKDPNHMINVAHLVDGGKSVAHAKQFTIDTTQFHTYGVDWEPDYITWYIDGVAVRSQPTPDGNDIPVYMMASLGGGSPYAGTPDETTPFPAEMKIDYIRAYASEHTVEKGVAVNKVGTDGADTLYGTSLGDTLNGGLGDDKLYGGAGNDTLTGGGGSDDLLDGGFGDDTYLVYTAADDPQEGSEKGIDTVKTTLSKYTLEANLENLIYIGSGVFTGGGTNADNELQLGLGSGTLSGSGGNDTLRGGTGVDALNGGDGNDIAYGGGGNDTLRGNNDNDILYGDDGDDLIKGDDGNDVLYGASGADNLQGGAGNDLLDGGTGKDRMSGGTGDDSYYVDVSTDSVTESAGEGTDTVYTALATYILAQNVENIIYTGASSVNITGNASNNRIAGSALADTMKGLSGNDVYVVNVSGDVVTENADEGSDTIETSLTSLTLAANVENLVYTGSKMFKGTGNTADNSLTGGAMADRLDGKSGADLMVGRMGNDTYVVDNIGDLVVEQAGEGADRVISQVSFTLGDNIETLQLSTSKAINGTGNASANTMVGNAGVNILDGRGGVDKLTGGAGNDTFLFQRGEANGDTVTDFTGAGQPGGDVLKFVGFGTGAIITQVGLTDKYQIHSGPEYGFVTETVTLAGVSQLFIGDYIFA